MSKTYGVGIMGAGNISAAYLRLAPLFHQPGALQNLEMFGNRREAHVEGRGKFRYCRFASCQPRENGASGRVGEGGKRRAQRIGRHLY